MFYTYLHTYHFQHSHLFLSSRLSPWLISFLAEEILSAFLLVQVYTQHIFLACILNVFTSPPFEGSTYMFLLDMEFWLDTCFSSILKMSFHCLLTSIISDEKLSEIQIVDPLWVMCHYSLNGYKVFLIILVFIRL